MELGSLDSAGDVLASNINHIGVCAYGGGAEQGEHGAACGLGIGPSLTTFHEDQVIDDSLKILTLGIKSLEGENEHGLSLHLLTAVECANLRNIRRAVLGLHKIFLQAIDNHHGCLAFPCLHQNGGGRHAVAHDGITPIFFEGLHKFGRRVVQPRIHQHTGEQGVEGKCREPQCPAMLLLTFT